MDYATIIGKIYPYPEEYMKILQIVFCVLACICVAAAVPVGIFFDLLYLLIPVAGAVLFGVLMVWCKNKTRPHEEKRKDFMDDENGQP